MNSIFNLEYDKYFTLNKSPIKFLRDTGLMRVVEYARELAKCSRKYVLIDCKSFKFREEEVYSYFGTGVTCIIANATIEQRGILFSKILEMYGNKFCLGAAYEDGSFIFNNYIRKGLTNIFYSHNGSLCGGYIFITDEETYEEKIVLPMNYSYETLNGEFKNFTDNLIEFQIVYPKTVQDFFMGSKYDRHVDLEYLITDYKHFLLDAYVDFLDDEKAELKKCIPEYLNKLIYRSGKLIPTNEKYGYLNPVYNLIECAGEKDFDKKFMTSLLSGFGLRPTHITPVKEDGVLIRFSEDTYMYIGSYESFRDSSKCRATTITQLSMQGKVNLVALITNEETSLSECDWKAVNCKDFFMFGLGMIGGTIRHE